MIADGSPRAKPSVASAIVDNRRRSGVSPHSRRLINARHAMTGRSAGGVRECGRGLPSDLRGQRRIWQH